MRSGWYMLMVTAALACGISLGPATWARLPGASSGAALAASPGNKPSQGTAMAQAAPKETAQKELAPNEKVQKESPLKDAATEPSPQRATQKQAVPSQPARAGTSKSTSKFPAGRSDPAPKRDPSASNAARAAKALVITPQREAAAISFVQEHHPELAVLLVPLKRSNSKEYEQAIRELFRTSERLAQAKERDDGRYQLELEIWKIESQIRLLVARLTMNPDDMEFQEELRELLVQRVDLRIRRHRLERDRLASRLERLDEVISSLEGERDKLVDQSHAQLLDSVTKFRGNRKASAAPPPKRPEKAGGANPDRTPN